MCLFVSYVAPEPAHRSYTAPVDTNRLFNSMSEYSCLDFARFEGGPTEVGEKVSGDRLCGVIGKIPGGIFALHRLTEIGEEGALLLNIAFGHVGLIVTDVSRSSRFYRDVLGLVEMSRNVDTDRGLETAYLGNDSAVLELLRYSDSSLNAREGKGRLDHVAWFVDDIRAAMEKMRGRGCEFRPNDPVNVRGERLVAFTNGPDGERIELDQILTSPDDR